VDAEARAPVASFSSLPPSGNFTLALLDPVGIGLLGLVAERGRHSLPHARLEVFMKATIGDRSVEPLRQCGNITLR
jgi:hypothetical protein